MKNIVFLTASTLLIVVAYSCKTATKTANNSKFNYEYLYNKTWVVDTIIVLGTDIVSTPNIETDKNEYQFAKEGTNFNQEIRTTITSAGASFKVPYTIEDGTIHFDPAVTFPLLKFDKNGNLISSNMYASLPSYKIMELGLNGLTLKNKDILMKLKAK